PVEREHTGIVRRPVVDQDTGVGWHGHSAQDLSELTSGEFARSTGAGGVVGQTLQHGSFRELDGVRLGTAAGACPDLSTVGGCDYPKRPLPASGQTSAATPRLFDDK